MCLVQDDARSTRRSEDVLASWQQPGASTVSATYTSSDEQFHGLLCIRAIATKRSELIALTSSFSSLIPPHSQIILTTNLAFLAVASSHIGRLRLVTQKLVLNMSLRRSSRITLLSSETNSSIGAKATTKKRAAEPTGLKTNGIKKPKSTATLKAAPTKSKEPLKARNAPDFKVPEIPATPKRKNTPKATTTLVPTLTPTPSLATILRDPSSTNDINDATSPPLDRPVEPHISNAILTTPHGTQVTAYPFDNTDPDSDLSPSKTPLPTPTATTGTLLTTAITHLTTLEPRLHSLTAAHPCNVFSPTGLAERIDPFQSLVSSIISQQVSTAAASSIKRKFIALFNTDTTDPHVWPAPEVVSKVEIEHLRTAGLSQRKAEYISGLASKFATGELSARQLLRASDEEVMSSLIAVRGLGKWSVEMFSCFGLKRMDVFSTGDLGVQRGMARFYGYDTQKLNKAKRAEGRPKGSGKWKYMSEEEMLERSEVFRPYRSLFMWYMWKVGDVDVGSVLDG
jgi:DNA-3-methyladenine glycosylase II